jgi:putative ABC transport system permease protein
MNIFENIKMAIESIKANKMRAFLTMLGIIIGISSVIMIMSLGQGGQQAINDQFVKLGATSVTVSVDTSKAQSTDYITLEDVKQIKDKIDTVKYASPSSQIMGVTATDKLSKNTAFRGGTTDLFYINDTEILYGRYFNEREFQQGAAVGIVDESTAKAIFGYSDVVGETLKATIGTISKKITIIGVEKGISLGNFGGGGNSGRPGIVTVPITFLSGFQSDFTIKSITVAADSKDNNETAGNAALNLLENRHNNRGKDVYTASNAISMLDQINSVLGIFTAFISAVAAISLLVGGIGVMNIMLVSVTERTREIGIRKAIGATMGTILVQFLIESVIISLIGGLMGMTLGLGGAFIIGNFIGITPAVTLTSVLGAILFSSAVGIFFGIYPARRAASLDPIEALRYE